MSRVALASVNRASSRRLEEFFKDETVREVMVNGGCEVWVERNGKLERVDTISEADTRSFIERTLLPLGRRIDITSPVVDARLTDGSRLCAVIPPIAVDGSCVSIRRFSIDRITLNDFADRQVGEILQQLVFDRRNLLISGAASAGKTTLLNSLCDFLTPNERVVTIEDIAELKLAHPHVVRLEARPLSPDGNLEISTRSLVRTALRLRPDRLIIGEVRGAETLDMLSAMNTGHDGSMSTIHANSARDALRRVESLVMQHATNWSQDVVRDHVATSINAIVHVARHIDGSRFIQQILLIEQNQLRVVVADGRIVDEVLQ
ncbi:MAG: CpaF family protein [Ilumatobacteraceae bacterium]|jgi:pilus assembly protein CpaF